MPEAGKDPLGDPEGQDTDEQFQDHPELAPSQGRIPVEKVKDLEAEARKRNLAGDGEAGEGGMAQDWTAHPPQPEDGGPAEVPPNHKVWAAILKRLGGSSPGSEENLQLAEAFSRVRFPADQEGVLAKVAPGAELRLREGIVVDLHLAIEHSRPRSYRSIGDLVDCVKDELRRMEADGLKVLKMA